MFPLQLQICFISPYNRIIKKNNQMIKTNNQIFKIYRVDSPKVGGRRQ